MRAVEVIIIRIIEMRAEKEVIIGKIRILVGTMATDKGIMIRMMARAMITVVITEGTGISTIRNLVDKITAINKTDLKGLYIITQRLGNGRLDSIKLERNK